MSLLTRDPIELDRLIARVAGPERGGIATFLGVVRDHQDGRTVTGLEYSAYEPMAEAECARIVAEAEARWPVTRGARAPPGPLAIGDIAVAIAAAADHRDGAFEACRHVIEEVKRRVPIWKREDYADGSTRLGRSHPAGARLETPPELRAPWLSRSRDRLGRPLGSLRLSVTDRCNMRCRYCMPEEEYVWLPRASILTFEEMHRLAGIFASLGVGKVPADRR